jgi:outer membrane lipoprotein-sorting protein
MKAKLFAVGLLIFSATAQAAPQGALQDLLTRMDQAAAKFQAMSAKVHYLVHTAVIDDTSEEAGSVRMKKVRAGEVQGIIEFTSDPDRRTVAFEQRKLQVFYPKINTVQIYDLGKHGEQLDQFLMIGFGISGTELAKSFNMKLLGTETVKGSTERALKVMLEPKDEEARKILKKAELWIAEPPKQPYPVQEQLYEPSGNYRLVMYSDLNINPPLTEDALKLKLPKGVKTEYPQK